jgi:serine/threonine-protein kinase
MGEVYLAHDALLGREVALKVLREPHAGSTELAERFRWEARHAAALSHPNIVQVYDAGETADGEPYMAMEHVTGGTLRNRLLERGTLPPRTAAAVALQIAEALSAAHQHGVIHRDIKPENVLVTDNGDVKVADFGIAKAADATAMTRTSLVLGTVRYLSPEQAMGEPVSSASDLYSLGVVLYEMLAGEVPFQAEGPIAIAMKHLSQEPAPLCERAPEVPASLNAVTLKLLEKDPEKRYGSAEEVAEDLKRFLVGEVPLATPATARRTPAEEEQPARGRRLLVTVLLALPVAIMLLVSISAAMGLTGSLTQHPLVAKVLPGEDHQQPFERALVPRVVAGEEIRAPETAQTTEDPQETREAAPPRGGSEEVSGSTEIAALPQRVASTEQKVAVPQPVVPQAPSQPQPREQRAPEPAETVSVPDLAGMTIVEAETALAEIHLILKVASYLDSESVPKGVVLSQDAPPGYQAQPGATVAVAVSSGPPPIPQSPESEPVTEPEDVEPSDRVEVPEIEVPEVASKTSLSGVTVHGTECLAVEVKERCSTSGLLEHEDR